MKMWRIWPTAVCRVTGARLVTCGPTGSCCGSCSPAARTSPTPDTPTYSWRTPSGRGYRYSIHGDTSTQAQQGQVTGTPTGGYKNIGQAGRGYRNSTQIQVNRYIRKRRQVQHRGDTISNIILQIYFFDWYECFMWDLGYFQSFFRKVDCTVRTCWTEKFICSLMILHGSLLSHFEVTIDITFILLQWFITMVILCLVYQ